MLCDSFHEMDNDDGTARLQPYRDQIEIFVEALLRHAGSQGFVSVRSFFENDDRPFRISPTSLKGGPRFLIDVAEDDARRAAQFPRPVVFCPPLAVFSNNKYAREIDIVLGPVLSVECDRHPQQAIAKLESLLGPPTIVVASGGKWIDPQTGEIQDKLHLHWRLRSAARGGDLPKLKQARDLAARIVGGDPSNKSVVHPIRWPGSWHRKGEPTLCTIKAANPDQEIDLETALTALRASAPAVAVNGKAATPPAEWRKLAQGVAEGERNASAARLAGYLLRRRVDAVVALELLQSWNATRCTPPLPENEVAKIVDSIAGRELIRGGAA
jgi:hypothetical protein